MIDEELLFDIKCYRNALNVLNIKQIHILKSLKFNKNNIKKLEDKIYNLVNLLTK